EPRGPLRRVGAPPHRGGEGRERPPRRLRRLGGSVDAAEEGRALDEGAPPPAERRVAVERGAERDAVVPRGGLDEDPPEGGLLEDPPVGHAVEPHAAGDAEVLRPGELAEPPRPGAR